MFIKNLKVSTEQEVIRNINFVSGLNLIVDDTPTDDKKQTGNNVGKTTVLKLIYFCLGGDDKEIYSDPENKKDIYTEVKDFLISNEVLITLTLVEDLALKDSNEIVIERNFLSNKRAIRKINGEEILKKDFDRKLKEIVFPELKTEKPTFKQLISHNIRYKDENINNTLKTLNQYTSDIEYEALYLYLLGCSFPGADQKQLLTAKLKQEYAYKDRLESKQRKNFYEIALGAIKDDIAELNQKKSSMNININFEEDLNSLNQIKYEINKISSAIGRLSIRKDIILEAQNGMEQNKANIDIKQLKMLYGEAKYNLAEINKTFEDLVNYHNKMIVEKIKFITKELPGLEQQIASEQMRLNEKLVAEKELAKKIAKSDSFEELEEIIDILNQKYQKKGEYENIISQIEEAENNIKKLDDELSQIDADIHSPAFEERLKTQRDKFNKLFSAISHELYGEKYALNFEKERDKKTDKPVYKFTSFNLNFSSGKKQGEIICFDLAYILFADQENIPCLHFLLNDKKELMHDNQLSKIADFVKDRKIQLVISMLKDKLPEGLIEKAHVAIELSQESKLFKIEQLATTS
ncbi:MAG: DUF2326 domain-containing protein [Candidatus Riflebacteria bacterium]|nr:DUF2326 domain-containing protein [Candidatus Riflebacteria bacterium]